MSDVYMPGVRSRFNSEQIIEGLMNLERIPKDRVQGNIDTLQLQKGYWREVGTRISSLRDSARRLFSFQNPFNERKATSTDSSVITANATRDAIEQSYNFTVKQTAAADRFLSQPLDERMRIEAGTYDFSVGEDKLSIEYRGGTLRDFADTINRRSRDKLSASLIAVQTGTRSLLIESKETGETKKLGFSGSMADLAVDIGMSAVSNDSQKSIPLAADSIQKSENNSANISVNDGVLQVSPQSTAAVPLNLTLEPDSSLFLKLTTQTKVETDASLNTPKPPPGPNVPTSSVTYGGITIENNPSSAPMPDWTPPPVPVRQDNMSVLNLTFTDGSTAALPAITDSNNPTERQYPLADLARGKTIASLTIDNTANTHRSVSVANIEVYDPTSTGGLKPLNPISTARDAIITMEGIEIKRPSNNIDDLIPGVTLNVRGVSDRPVELNVKTDIEAVKDSIISFVANYNRLLAEINVLTSTTGSNMPDLPRQSQRGDMRLIEELTYLTKDEAEEMRERLGVFGGDVTLNTLKNNLTRTVSAPYPTSLERDLALLAQIGVSTNAERSTGYDASRLRGYLQIHEETLDAALQTKIPAIKELFASDTSGDLLADTGVAFNIDALISPYVGTGGIVSLKTNTLDSRISQDERRISTLDRQLAAKEQELKIQYAKMESAYARMEQMSNSLDNFSQQGRSNR